MHVVNRRIASTLIAAAAVAAAPGAHAIQFSVGDDINGTVNTVMTLGAGIRMENRSVNNVGKANLNPAVCANAAQSCQGVFKGQIHPAQTLAASPGQAFLNADDGNWNYDKGDLTQAVFKVTQDVSLTMGNYGFFGKWLYFYDFVNNDFTEFHPNLITNENHTRVGCTGTTRPAPPGGPCYNADSPTQARAYGPGEPTYLKRTDGETLRQIGTDLQLFDYYIFGSNTLPFTEDHSFSWKLGSQTVNWGESTALPINSVNQINPVNANNLFRVGFDLSELYTPTRMLTFSTDIVEGVTLESYVGLQWKPVEIPAAGSFFSFADLGSYNGGPQGSSISFGGPAEDPEICHSDPTGAGTGTNGTNPNSGCGSPTNNPLSGLTGTALTIRRVGDKDPSQTGQYGISVKYFADWLNNGTQLAFYALNYHSKLPYVSFYSSDPSCARAEGNAAHNNATSGPTLIADCPGLPFLSGGAAASSSNAVPIDTVRYQVEYPENIHMFGASFNTTLGDLSIQGEMSYRPNLPLQIDLQDLTFLALQPMLARCHDPSGPCTGTNAGTSTVDGYAYGSSDFNPYPGITAYPDTFDLGIGAAVGSARSFPSFIGAYRGIPAGEMPPNSYIRGYERFGVWQLDLGATYVEGATDNLIGADQVIWLFEFGAQYVPSLPGTDVIQIEAPNTNYHHSAGADGSMTGNMKEDCASTIDCNYGGYDRSGNFYGGCTQAMLNEQNAVATSGAAVPNGTPSTNTNCGDGLRFNPHQEPAEGYADKFSTGIVIVNLTRYESVFPGISFAPITIFMWDVKGTSVDVASQFTEGRKDISFLFETRYKESLSFTAGYLFFTGGHGYNTQSDRDQALAYVKYQF